MALFRRMRILLLSLAFAMAGCGGGGGGGGWDHGGSSYVPPDTVMSRQDQAQVVARSISGTADLEGYTQGTYDTGYDPLSGILDGFAARSVRVASVRSAALGISLAQRQRTRQYTETIDRVDDYGIHWVGTYREEVSSLSLNLTGTTSQTRVEVVLHISGSDSNANMVLGVHGNLPIGSGRVLRTDSDFSMDISAGSTSGSGEAVLNSGGEVTDAASGVVVSRNIANARVTVTLSSGGSGTIAYSAENTNAQRIGEGLFWVHLNESGSASAEVYDDYTDTTVRSLVITGEASNGMRINVRTDPAGVITGTVVDASGATVARFSGAAEDGSVLVDYVGTQDSETLYLA